MESKVLIEVTGCPDPAYWYAKHVGLKFHAEPKLAKYNGYDVYVVDISHLNYHAKTGYIATQYAKIIKEKKTKTNKGE